MKFILLYISLTSLILLSSCSVPFDQDSDPITIEVPNTLGAYVEQAIDVPSELQDSNLEFTEVTIMYIVTKTDALTADVSLYVSPYETVSLMPGTDHEKIVDVSIAWNQRSQTGESYSTNIEYALNNGYQQIFLGVKNFSIGLINPVTVELTINFKGMYTVF